MATDNNKEQETKVREAAGEAPAQTADSAGKGQSGSAFEGIYDRMPDISVKALDRFILVCVFALVAVVLIGILKANHVF